MCVCSGGETIVRVVAAIRVLHAPCVGKDTNFNASYWQTEERIFETEEKENL